MNTSFQTQTPEDYGRWLASCVKSAHASSERLNQVGRCDAICWYLSQVGYVAKAKDVKRFATAFRGFFATKRMWNHETKSYGDIREVLDMCYSLLNICYGGVSSDFSGKPFASWHGNGENGYKHYGSVAPLWRPSRGLYSPTIGGLRRAARVQSMLDVIGSQS